MALSIDTLCIGMALYSNKANYEQLGMPRYRIFYVICHG